MNYNPKLEELKLNPYNDLEEISIQDEVIDFISGADFGIDKFIPYIYRSLKRDKYGKSIKCTCWGEFSNEGAIGCPYCDGVGYYWTETIQPGIVFILNKRKIGNALDQSDAAGREDTYELGFITRFDTVINQSDIIISPHVNDQGFFQIPYKIDKKYIVKESIERRLDMNRKEYSLSIISKVE